MELTKRVELGAGLALLALIAAGCLLVVAPFLSSILWAAIICFATWPLHVRVERLCGGRRTLAASLMTALIVVVMLLPFLLAALTLDENIAALFSYVHTANLNGLPPPPDWIGRIPMAGDWLQTNWAAIAADSEKSHSFVKMVMDHAKGDLLHLSRSFIVGLVHLGISVFVAFFFYRDGDRLVAQVATMGKHVLGEYSQHLVRVTGNTIRSVVYGFLGTALVQGVLATVGFVIVGAPAPLLLGLFTFVLALLPFGPPLVWIPVTVWLAVHQQIGLAIFMGVWGLLVVSGIDHFLRPYLISRESRLPFVLVFLGAMGGVLAFGFIGIFVGPTLLAAGYGLLHEFLIRRGPPVPGAETETPNPPHA